MYKYSATFLLIQVAELYRKQQQIQNQLSLEKDDDFY